MEKNKNRGESLIKKEIGKHNIATIREFSKPVISKTTVESRVESIQNSIRKYPEIWKLILREARIDETNFPYLECPEIWKKVLKDAKEDFKRNKAHRISGLEYLIICYANGSVMINEGVNRSFREIANKPTMSIRNEAEIKSIYYNAILKFLDIYKLIRDVEIDSQVNCNID